MDQSNRQPRRQSGQSVIKDFLDNIDDIITKYSNLKVTIVWMPGHMTIREEKEPMSLKSNEPSNKLIIQSQNIEISTDSRG